MFKPVQIELKGRQEIAHMREAGRIVAEALALLSGAVRPGVSTADLDGLAASELARRGARSAFLGYRGYPATLCVSVNEEVVHGIPRADKKLAEGDIVSLDFGCVWRGFYGDAAITVGVGEIAPEAERLIRATRESLEEGIRAIRPDCRLGDVSHAVQRHVEARGFSVVRDFVGHGIGRALHEDPQVPNFGAPKTGPRLVPGMVLALEPMVVAGSADVEVLGDGWTAVTKDGRLAAHFEHTVAVTESGAEILTLPGRAAGGRGT